MRNGIILIGIAFAVALAAVAANQLSDQALAVVVGATCGISASIPVTIGLLLAVSRNWDYYGARRNAAQPPMVIFTPPQQAQRPYGFPQNQSIAPALGAPREFKIIGGE